MDLVNFPTVLPQVFVQSRRRTNGKLSSLQRVLKMLVKKGSQERTRQEKDYPRRKLREIRTPLVETHVFEESLVSGCDNVGRQFVGGGRIIVVRMSGIQRI